MTTKRYRIQGLIAGLLSTAAVALLAFSILSCAEKRAEAEKLERQMNGSKTTQTTEMSPPEQAVPPTDSADDEEEEVVDAEEEGTDDSMVEGEDDTAADSLDTLIEEDTARQSERHVTMETRDSNVQFDPDEVPVVDEPRKTKPGELVGSGGFTLQIASTDSRAYAEQLVDEFKQHGYQPYISELSIDGVTRYRVRVGQFSSSTEVERMRTLFAEEYGIDGWVDRVR